MGTAAVPSGVTAAGILGVLSKARLSEIARTLDVPLPPDAQKATQVSSILAAESALEALLPRLTRDELRAACRAHSLDHTARSRAELMARLGIALQPALPDADRELHHSLGLPFPGDIAVVRHRQYLVEDVRPGEPGQQTAVKLVCLDDDAAGRELEVLWERELGARVLKPEDKGLGAIERMDPPRHFAAYLHALRWSSVTSTDGKLFQAPFRAGIKLMRHQLVPLMKALELPRANLFIADDVGLGKTIEAGLVMQELLLRQRIDQILIVAPAAVCLQWQGEMEKRFGLRFEIRMGEDAAASPATPGATDPPGAGRGGSQMGSTAWTSSTSSSPTRGVPHVGAPQHRRARRQGDHADAAGTTVDQISRYLGEVLRKLNPPGTTGQPIAWSPLEESAGGITWQVGSNDAGLIGQFYPTTGTTIPWNKLEAIWEVLK